MARHKLENELIAIEVEEHGAELKSLVRKNTGKEYMWKADPKFWGRTSPVLFPFVGAVKEKQFRTKGQTYTMGSMDLPVIWILHWMLRRRIRSGLYYSQMRKLWKNIPMRLLFALDIT